MEAHRPADETSMPMQRKGTCMRGFVRAFLGGGMVGCRFSGDRSAPLAWRCQTGRMRALLQRWEMEPRSL